MLSPRRQESIFFDNQPRKQRRSADSLFTTAALNDSLLSPRRREYIFLRRPTIQVTKKYRFFILLTIITLITLTAPARQLTPNIQQHLQLEPRLAQLLNSLSTHSFQTQLSQIESQLDQAAQIALKTQLYGTRPHNPYITQLYDLIQNLMPPLAQLNTDLTALADYLDWYPDNDWEQRFEQTGYYFTITSLHRRARFALAKSRDYQALHHRFTASADNARLTADLKESAQLLNDWQQQASPSPERQLLRIWLFRLLDTLAHDNPDYQQSTLAVLHLLESTDIDPSLTDEFRALRYHYQLQRESNPLALLSLRNAMEDQLRRQIKDPRELAPQLLKTLMLYAQARRSRLTPDTPRLDDSTLMTLSSYYHQHQPLRAFIAQLTAGPWCHTPKPPAQLTAFEQLCLLDLWQSSDNPDHWHNLITQAPLWHQRFADQASEDAPLVFFWLGQTAWRLAEHPANQNTAADSRSLKAAAISAWHTLAQNTPQWHYELSSTETVTAADLIERAAAAAFNLFTADPDTYAPLAQSVLQTLTGSLQNHLFIGPFTDVPSAPTARYQLGQVYLHLNQPARAQAILSHISPDHPHYYRAWYFRCLAQSQAAATDKPDQLTPSLNTPNTQALVIADLRRLITALASQPPTDENAQTAAQATLLAADLLLQTQGPAPCLELLDTQAPLFQPYPLTTAIGRAVLQDYIRAALQQQSYDRAAAKLIAHIQHTDPPRWVIQLAAQTLQQGRPILLTAHAQCDTTVLQTLPTRTQLAAALTRCVQAHPDTPDHHKLKDAFRRDLLESLCLALTHNITLTTTDDATDPAAPQTQAQAIITQILSENPFDRSILIPRCRALLAMHAQQYQQARVYWSQIRAATNTTVLDPNCYYWWEARTLALQCLIRENQSDQARHILNVTRREDHCPPASWSQQLDQIQDQLPPSSAPAATD